MEENQDLNLHPGFLLKRELDGRGLKQRDFANEIQISYSQFNEIIKGKRNITSDLAILLEAALGVEALFWLKYQAIYDINKSREKPVKPISAQLEKWSKIREYIPYAYLKKMGIISGDVVKDEEEIRSLYNITNLEELAGRVTTANHGTFRRTEKRAFNPVNVMGWLSLVELNSRKQKVEVFNAKKIDDIIPQLKKVFSGKDIENKTRKILNEAGIKFIVLEERPEQTPVDGVAFWSGKNPVIGMSKRYDRLDNFAFTLFHEIGHVAKHLDKIKKQQLNVDMVDNLDDYARNHQESEELEANEFASNNLIPKEAWEQFNNEHYNFSDLAIDRFAKKMGIPAAIVVGRLRHENPNLYRRRFRISNEIN